MAIKSVRRDAHRAASAHPGPIVRGRIELPKVVEIALKTAGTDTAASKKPEIAAAVGPACGSIAASGEVSGSRHTQRAVHSGLVTTAASAHPRPFFCRRIELPKVVERNRTVASVTIAVASKEPEMAAAVGPTSSSFAGSGNVSGNRYAQRAVHSLLVTTAASAHPGPLVLGRIELPKVVERAMMSIGIVANNAPKEPEIAAAVGPGRSAIAGSGDVAGSWHAQCAIHSGLADRAASAHPDPSECATGHGGHNLTHRIRRAAGKVRVAAVRRRNRIRTHRQHRGCEYSRFATQGDGPQRRAPIAEQDRTGGRTAKLP